MAYRRAMTTARRHALPFVLATIFIDAIGFGLIMPVLPRLLMRVGDLDLPQAIAVAGNGGRRILLGRVAAKPQVPGRTILSTVSRVTA